MKAIRTRKATFNLSEELLAELSQAVDAGAARSKNAFVEEAITKELRVVRDQWLAQRWAEAARDPLFKRDIKEVERDFADADAESAREIR